MKLAPHPFTLRQLQYVVAVADTLSFREAAALCHVSQPALSTQLAQLEEAIGVRLFERDRRGVLPTNAGKDVVDRARRLLLDTEALVAAAKTSADPLESTLRLGIIPTVSPYLLPSVTPALRKAFPLLKAVWVEDKTANLVAALEAGTLDAALVALEAELGSELDHETVAVDPFVLATRKGDPLGQRAAPVERTELREVDVLLLDDGHCFRDQALSFCSRVKAHELEFRATSLSTLAQMVAGGSGVTLLPQLAVATEASRARLQTRAFASPAPSRTIAFVWRKRSPLGPSLHRLSKLVHEVWPGR